MTVRHSEKGSMHMHIHTMVVNNIKTLSTLQAETAGARLKSMSSLSYFKCFQDGIYINTTTCWPWDDHEGHWWYWWQGGIVTFGQAKIGNFDLLPRERPEPVVHSCSPHRSWP